MNIRNALTASFAALALALLTAAGCAVVDASSISIETLKGTVMLSGFAKNSTEKSTAEAIARRVNGAKAVKNEIAVRP